MAYTTGLVTNTRATGTAATTIVVNTRNAAAGAATVTLKIFAVSPTTLTLTPIYVSSFAVAGYAADIRTFTIAGNIAYEVQLDNSAVLANPVYSTYGLDEFGNLVTEQGFPQAKMTMIPALVPT
ncbi:hypothetical protein HGI30_20665 [Paenibacillus albicereus]|uniref:Uncharacterized protein n=1 Tax=Paenibacillus albicereus TaxID=2726185 RepID=A0A6H2H2Y5_9BACL|nr:hypothetical protein [Paenibacillus albicereus]QJC53698.1 hypothetical protein HGI30_20665 [Paenibacillus albicereus]